MANHPSALKRHRQSLKRRDRNRYARASIRTAIKSTLSSIETGDANAAKESAQKATSLIDKAVVHGVLHKNNAKRRISRLYKKLNSL